MLLTLGFLLSLTSHDTVAHVDLIERNDTPQLSQFVFWELAPRHWQSAYRVVDWRLCRNCGDVIRTRTGYALSWRERGRRLRVTATCYVNTKTTWDVELADRDRWPESRRRGLH